MHGSKTMEEEFRTKKMHWAQYFTFKLNLAYLRAVLHA